MNAELSRRRFLQDTAMLAGAMAAMQSIEGLAAEAASPPALPTIRLGQVEVSRLILGSNPFFGYAHRDGDYGRLMKEYYSDQRIMEVLANAAAVGVTAVAAPPSADWIRVFDKYRAAGGKLTWIAQPHGAAEQMKAEIDTCAKAGAQAAFIQGHRVEEQFEKKTFEVVRGWLEHIKSHGMAAGIAAHRPERPSGGGERGFPRRFLFPVLLPRRSEAGELCHRVPRQGRRDHPFDHRQAGRGLQDPGRGAAAARGGIRLRLQAPCGQGRRVRRHLQQGQAGHAGRRLGARAAGGAGVSQRSRTAETEP